MAWMRTKIEIPKNLKPSQREQLAESIIEFIRLRTISGLDKNNRKFYQYTKDYAEKKGVSRSDVDLNLSSEMMEALSLLSHSSGSILIGFDKDDENNGKAEGNIKGTYGQPKPVTKPRDFLGITKKDLRELISSGAFNDRADISDEDIDAIAREAADRLVGGLQFDDN